MFRNKRGVYFFVIDVIVAILIFSVTVAIIAGFNISQPSTASTEEVMNIIVVDVMQTEIRDVTTSQTLQDLRLDGTITDLDLTIDQVILILLEAGDTGNASNIIQEATAWVSPQFGLEYVVDAATIYSQTAILSEADSTVRLSTRKISSIEADLYTSFPTNITEVLVWQ